MPVVTREYEGALVVELTTPLPTDSAGLQSLRAEIYAAIEGAPEPVLVDLRGVERMSPAQIGAVLLSFSSVKSWACLVTPKPTAIEMHTRPVVRVYPNEDEALRALLKQSKHGMGCLALSVLCSVGAVASSCAAV